MEIRQRMSSKDTKPSKEETIDLCSVTTSTPTPPTIPIPCVLTIAGSDCSGGAGIEADLKTITTHKCYGATCITAITVQNSKGVKYVKPTSSETIEQILKCLLDDKIDFKAIKIGVLPEDSLQPLSKFLSDNKNGLRNIILDPVFSSNSGDDLIDIDAFGRIISLFEYCDLITPNFAEAKIILAYLTGSKEDFQLEIVDDLIKITRLIGEGIKTNVLVKGGHIPFDSSNHLNLDHPEIVFNALYKNSTGEVTLFKSHYIHSENTHGTGCTLSSSIASNLAKGFDLEDSLGKSIEYVTEAIRLSEPKPNGPVNHTYDLPDSNFNLLEYLINHKDVKDAWYRYTHHEFVKLVVSDALPVEKFHHYIEQDYIYLQNYLWVHQRMVELAPTEHLKKDLEGIVEAIKSELVKHTERLANSHQILDADKIEPNSATVAYTEYLLRTLQQSNSFLKSKVSVTPCLIGYNMAVANLYNPGAKFDVGTGKRTSATFDKDEIPNVEIQEFRDWLIEYSNDFYLTACEKGQESLNEFYLVRDKYTGESVTLDELVKIFKDVTLLECDFWDACL